MSSSVTDSANHEPLLADSHDADGSRHRKSSTIADALIDALSHDHDGEVLVHSAKSMKNIDSQDTWKWNWAVFWRFCGPGILASIAYIDPGNIEADVQAGIAGGYSLGWLLFWSTALGLFFQIISARLGVVAGKQMAVLCREEYNRPTSIALWLWIELAIVASDIQEVVGSAIAFELLFGLPLWIGVLLTGLDTFTFLLLEKGGVRRLEAFFCALVATMTVAFVVVWAMGKPNMGTILRGVAVPDVQHRAVDQAVGMLGAVIMPMNLFLYSSLVLSRQVPRRSKGRVEEANAMNAVESSGGLFVSFIINLAIMSLFANKFYKPVGSYCAADIKCSDVGLKEAGSLLENTLSHTAGKVIWGVGLLAAGQTRTGTLAGQAVMQGFLQLKMKAWKRVLLTRSIAIVPSIAVAILASGFMDSLNESLNVLQSLVLPFALFPMLKLTASKSIMGPYRLKSGWLVVSWVAAAVIVIINGYLVAQTVQSLPHTWYVYLAVAVIGTLYLAFCAYLAWVGVGEHRGDPSVRKQDRMLRETAGQQHRMSTSSADDAPPDVPWWVREEVDQLAETVQY